MMEPSTPSPKRKRAQEHPMTPIKFSFDPGRSSDAADQGSDSPRTCVTHKFRGLALAGDGEDDSSDWTQHMHSPLKRQKADEVMEDAPPLTNMAATDSLISVGFSSYTQPCNEAETALAHGTKTQVAQYPHMDSSGEPADSQGKTHTLPIIGTQFKLPQQRRAGTPPLKMRSSPAQEKLTLNDFFPQVVDPVRAALTWHEDEITVYDPNDADDDGTGVNGIGFKPTPALARVRVLKRRQQLAEYRRREENEARALRSARRRNATSMPEAGVRKRKSPTRRVRFVDTEAHKIAVTTI